MCIRDSICIFLYNCFISFIVLFIYLFIYFLFPQVNSAILNQLIGKIREDLPGLEVGDETEQITKHFNNTISHIQSKKENGTEQEIDMYKDVVL